MRRICYLTGTRADFGLMLSTLRAIDLHESLSLELIVTGMHLSPRFGLTVREIETTGLAIAARVPVDTDTATGASMARGLAAMLDGVLGVLERQPPDALLLLGDRGEMLAGALAALHLNIPSVHIHGGERSGTIDESVRHAISKLSHYHFAATAQSRARLIAMGEQPDTVFVTGAPGLDGLRALAGKDRQALCAELGLTAGRRTALFIYHPVVQEAAQAGNDAQALVEACLAAGLQVVALMPNADAGSDQVRAALARAEGHPDVRVLTHLPRPDFVSWMAVCDIMVGNSSSGIIEAASFGTPVLNVGSRQNLRERNANVMDLATPGPELPGVLDACLRAGRFAPANVYGDGRAGPRIANLLASVDLSPSILLKAHAH